jgi:hypothetical protein
VPRRKWTSGFLRANSNLHRRRWCQEAIAEALKVNAVLTDLRLVWNSIGAEGAIAIAEALKVNAVLTTLDLGANDIGVEGAIAIAEVTQRR